MNLTTSNETRELNVEELNIVTGGGVFSLLLRISGNNLAATVYEQSGARDVPVGLPK